MVKNPPAMQETYIRSLGREDPLEKGMATHSSILAWRIPWTEEPGEPQSMGLQRVGHDWVTNTHIHTSREQVHCRNQISLKQTNKKKQKKEEVSIVVEPTSFTRVRSANFSIKGQTVNTLSFVGHIWSLLHSLLLFLPFLFYKIWKF